MNWKQILADLQQKRAALMSNIDTAETKEALDTIEMDIRKVDMKILEAKEKVAEEERAAQPTEPVSQRTLAVNEGQPVDPVANQIEQRTFNPGTNFNPVAGASLEKRGEIQIDYEKRGKDLFEKRAITVGSSSIILPKHQSTDIKGTFNQVSSLIDGVTVKPLIGGESYEKPYVKGYGTGDYTAESGTPATTEPKFGYAQMTKSKIAAYAEDTEEVEKLPAAAYAQEVEKGIRIALRKKGTAEILIGDGTTGHLMGIFHTPVIETSSDLEVGSITNTTLDDIIFSYGGDEEVEDAAVLILNKRDLKAFAQLRTNDGKKVHTIVANGNTGTIDGIPYLINSNCKPLSLSTTVAGDYCMAYGPLSNYEMPVFSDVEITKSTDYKFKEGMIAHRGVAFIGGNVVAHNGFLRVKKA